MSDECDWKGLNARPLFLAIKQRRTAELDRLLGDPTIAASVNDLDNDGIGLLHLIVFGDLDIEAIDVIVRRGGNVDLRNKHSETPLALAALYKKPAFAERFLRLGASVTATDWQGRTVLKLAKETMFFGKKPSAEVTKQLLGLIEDANARQCQGAGNELKLQQATAHREAGNAAFNAGRYREALNEYSRSLELSEDYRTYANRAAVFLKLGLAQYRERRETHGLNHQISDGEAKVIQWVPDADGSCSTPDEYRHPPPGLPSGCFCDGQCSRSSTFAFRCRSVETLDAAIGGLYRQAVGDAARAKTMEPTFFKAYFRQAKGSIGLRDFPRARIALEEGLKHCPGNESLQKLLNELLALGVGERGEEGLKNLRFSNPSCPEVGTSFAKGERAFKEGHALIFCAYCAVPIAGKRKTLPELGQAAIDGVLTKEQALRKCGFPEICLHCACNPCADIDQRRIRALIEA